VLHNRPTRRGNGSSYQLDEALDVKRRALADKRNGPAQLVKRQPKCWEGKSVNQDKLAPKARGSTDAPRTTLFQMGFVDLPTHRVTGNLNESLDAPNHPILLIG